MLMAFGTHFMGASAFHGVISKFLTFVALDQLKLGGIFLWKESLVVDVESMFDALIGQVWIGEKSHE